jgi:hypothetical protein
MMLWTIAAVVLCAAILTAQPGQATLGVDVSSSVLPNSWSCLKSNGYTFGIIRWEGV